MGETERHGGQLEDGEVIAECSVLAAELVRRGRRGGINFEKLEVARRRVGIDGDGEGWPKEFNNPAFSRQVLGLA